MRNMWKRFLALLSRLNCACGLGGLRRDNPTCCADLDAARRQRRRVQWERERCGL